MNALRLLPSLLVMMLVCSGAQQAAAQSTVKGVPNALQGFSKNRDKPIQIDAASLEVRDKDKQAMFAGNVKVVQGDTVMKSKTLVVFYDGGPGDQSAKKGGALKAAQPGPGGSQSIKRLEARGGVVVTQNDQTVTGATGIFDMKANTVTLTGGVVLTQGQNVLRGDRLVVDLATGVSRVEAGASTNGRVQGLFYSSGSKQGNSLLPGMGGKTGEKSGEKPAGGDSGRGAQTDSKPGAPMRLNRAPLDRAPQG